MAADDWAAAGRLDAVALLPLAAESGFAPTELPPPPLPSSSGRGARLSHEPTIGFVPLAAADR